MNENSPEQYQPEQLQLMQETLDQIAIFSQELSLKCKDVNDFLISGNVRDGIPVLLSVLEGVGFVAQGLQMTAPLRQAQGIEVQVSSLPSILTPLVGALEAQDYGLVRDLVDYELSPFLATCTRVAGPAGRKAVS